MNQSVPAPRFSAPDAIDRRIIAATQTGLPLVARPYDAIGEEIGIGGAEVIARLKKMLECGMRAVD